MKISKLNIEDVRRLQDFLDDVKDRLELGGDDEVEVDVVYRTITETEEGFVRDPISAVVVTMRIGVPDFGVITEPVPIPVPTLGSVAPQSPSVSVGDN